MSAIKLSKADALLVIETQSDALPNAHEVITPINQLLAIFEQQQLPVFTVRAPGAVLVAELAFPDKTVVMPDATGLAKRLNQHGTQRLTVCGFATDDCMLDTVSDTLGDGFEVLVVPEAMRLVDLHPFDGARAIDRMVARGGVAVRLGEAGMTALSVS